MEKLELQVQERQDLTQKTKDGRYLAESGPPTFGQAAKTKLGNFLRVVNGYVAVLDAVASAYPGWESLAWGAVRFLLTASIKYSTLQTQVKNYLEEIGDNFKKISFLSKVYATEEIVEHVCGACSEFVQFLDNAVRIYKSSRLSELFGIKSSKFGLTTDIFYKKFF